MNFKRLERIVKGFLNHRRIAILNLVYKKPELFFSEIADELKINIKTAGEHTRKLAIAGLLMKRYDLNNVRHKVTDLGETILKFLRRLE